MRIIKSKTGKKKTKTGSNTSAKLAKTIRDDGPKIKSDIIAKKSRYMPETTASQTVIRSHRCRKLKPAKRCYGATDAGDKTDRRC